MNHIKLRRLALSAASVSFSALAALLLLWSSVRVYGDGNMRNNSVTETVCNGESVDNDSVVLPANISCTPLIVEQLVSYDGKFLEDGSGREVINVAAIMLYNSSERIIPYAYVTVYTQSCQYTFDAFMLPPKSTVLVPDADAQQLTNEKIVRTFGWMTVMDDSMKAFVGIREEGMGCLYVENLSGQRLRNLTIHHRSYLEESDFFVGGRTFQTNIPELPPGETVMIYPSNYVCGYSKVVYCE